MQKDNTATTNQKNSWYQKSNTTLITETVKAALRFTIQYQDIETTASVILLEESHYTVNKPVDEEPLPA